MIINSQLGGKKPTGTKSITSNGIHDVADYASADVQVPTSNITRFGSDVRAFLGEVDTNGILQNPTTPQVDLVFSGVKGLEARTANAGVLFRRFQYLNTIKTVSFPDLETTSVPYGMANCFYGCTGITSVSMPKLETITNYGLNYCFYTNTSLTTIDLSKVTSVASYGMYYCFYGCTSLTSVDLSSLQTITADHALSNAFSGCTGLTSVDLSSLQTITAAQALSNAFSGCTGLTSVNMGSVTSINAVEAIHQCFSGCTSLTNIDLHSLTYLNGGSAIFNETTALESLDLSALETIYNGSSLFSKSGIKSINLKNLKNLGIGGNYNCALLFQGCSRLEKVKFESLNSIGTKGNWLPGQFFGQCTSLTELWFYAAKSTTFTNSTNSTFASWLTGCTGVTVHFPKEAQTKLTSFSSVTSGLGGTNTTVLFDIVTTLIGANSISYTRQEKDSTSSAIAWVRNNVLYYTSGTTEPAVGDTIYSDSACTQAVTTISSIA